MLNKTGEAMELTSTKLYLIITFTVLSLIGIVLIQYNWIDNALKLEEEMFNKQVSTIGSEITQAMCLDCDLFKNISNVVESICEHTLPALAEDHKMEMTESIKSIVDSVFTANDFYMESYEFGLIVTVSDKTKKSKHTHVVLASNDDSDPGDLNQFSHSVSLPAPANAASLTFYFPQKGFFIARQVILLLILSVLFILMICIGFGYVIMTIRKQKKLSEMKNDFINNLTHEFKTPIFSISLASKLLGQSTHISDSEKLNKYLNLIHSENNRLRTQVDKVLQMALVDSGSFYLNRSEVDIHALVKQVCETFSVMLEEKGGAITLHLDATHHMLHGDEAHLANLIYNLIDNGIKYSSDAPEITVVTMDTEKGLCLTIKDNGIGIDAQVQKHIFDKFYRVQTGNIHDVKGFGLGLSYVKSIVEAHKGLIKLNSSYNSGSEFVVTLPLN